ncbi:hypothetical protein FRC16_004311, partial [Serendipita sp. 398]
MVLTHTLPYKLFFIFGLVSNYYVNQAWAFTTTLPSSATQCGSYTVTWSATESQSIGPPFKLSIIPVNGPQASSADAGGLGPAGLSLPIVTTIPDTAFDAVTRSGSFKIDAFPLRSGERFIVVMDDGFGLGTGGVSSIQTVSSTAQGSGCLPDQNANSNVPFTLSTLTPTTCQALTITSGPVKAIRGFIPGGKPFSLDVGTAGGTSVTTEWTIDVAASTSFVLLYEGSTAGVLASSGLITVGSGSCSGNGTGSLSTTSGGSAIVASASSSNTSSRSSSSSSSSSASQSSSPGSSTSSTSASTTVGNTGGSGNGALQSFMSLQSSFITGIL